jgi:hypothetical protein
MAVGRYHTGVAAVVLMTLVGPGRAQERDARQDPPQAGSDLALTDLAVYRSALDGKPPGPALPVTFRALWDHPERYQGHRVRVEGRVQRRFHQGAFGTFPPLVESWVVSPAGDPFCLVFPDPPGRPPDDPSAPGALVEFEGVFLRQVRYRGGDAPRLAPLIVGDQTPKVTLAAPPKPRPGGPEGGRVGGSGGFSTVEWSLGLGAAVLVALVLAFQYLRQPPRRSLHLETNVEPPPDFVDPA